MYKILNLSWYRWQILLWTWEILSFHDNTYKSSVKVWIRQHFSICHSLPGTTSGYLVLSSGFCENGVLSYSPALGCQFGFSEGFSVPRVTSPDWNGANSQESIDWPKILYSLFKLSLSAHSWFSLALSLGLFSCMHTLHFLVERNFINLLLFHKE